MYTPLCINANNIAIPVVCYPSLYPFNISNHFKRLSISSSWCMCICVCMCVCEFSSLIRDITHAYHLIFTIVNVGYIDLYAVFSVFLFHPFFFHFFFFFRFYCCFIFSSLPPYPFMWKDQLYAIQGLLIKMSRFASIHFIHAKK